MKSYYSNTWARVLLTSLIIMEVGLAWGQEFEWIRKSDPFGDISVNGSGVYLVGGDIMRKYDADGSEIWSNQFTLGTLGRLNGISVAASAVYICGNVSIALPDQVHHGYVDAFIGKYDTDGNEIWIRQFGTEDGEFAHDIAVDDSGVYVIGSNSGLEYDMFIRKYDADGNEIWARRLGGSDYPEVSPSQIVLDETGVYVCGSVSGALPGFIYWDPLDGYVVKYDREGNEVWLRQFNLKVKDWAEGISVDASGIYVVGFTDDDDYSDLPGSLPIGARSGYIRKYDWNGNVEWTSFFGAGTETYAYQVSTSPTGAIVVGSTNGALPGQTHFGSDDAYLSEFDINGNELRTYQLGTDGSDRFRAIYSYSMSQYILGEFGNVFPGLAMPGGFVAKVGALEENQAPKINTSVDDIEFTVGDEITLDLTAVFNDPDGDELSFSASSNNESVAGVSISNGSLTVDALTEGTTTITVTADDGNGGMVEDEFVVTVVAANVGPVVSDAIQDIELIEGEDQTVDLTKVFNDPDGDELSFSASSNNQSVAGVSISNGSLTVNALTVGTATITVTADDGNGGTVKDEFVVTVVAANVGPLVSEAIQDIELIEGEDQTIDLATVFNDPDGDELSFSASSNNQSVAGVSIGNSSLTVDALTVGTATITVTADDGNGGTVEDEFVVTVVAANVGPLVSEAIQDIELIEGEDQTVDLTKVFNDPDGDELSFSASSNNESVAGVSINNGSLTVDALTAGTASITVTADDGNGGKAEDEFLVMVAAANADPVVSDAIQDIELILGEDLTLDLTMVFNDPDGDDLTFTATISDQSVATVGIDNGNLIVSALAKGIAIIIVTADDGNGGTVKNEFIATIIAPNAVPTVSNAIQNIELTAGEDFVVDLNLVFNDPDGDDLSFTATSDNGSIAMVNISNATLTVNAVSAGSVTIIVTAEDSNGGTVENDFTAIIVAANVTPTVSDAIQDLDLIVGEDFTVDLTEVFNDSDGDDLSFTASSSDESVTVVSISNGSLIIDAQSEGAATITVTADDGNGGVVSISFDTFNSMVTSLSQQQDLPKEFALSQNYPNPFNRSTTIPFSIPEETEVTIYVYSVFGEQVEALHMGRLSPGNYERAVDATNLAAGVYVYRLESNSYKQAKLMILQ